MYRCVSVVVVNVCEQVVVVVGSKRALFKLHARVLSRLLSRVTTAKFSESCLRRAVASADMEQAQYFKTLSAPSALNARFVRLLLIAIDNTAACGK